MTIDLTLACTKYDWTRALWDGEIQPEGINLHLVDYHNPERFSRMVQHQEFDACELSLGSYLATVAHEKDYPFTAIPVFPYRKFRHSFVYRRAEDDFGMADLNTKDVGLIHWQTTTGIWQRGIASEHYGVDLDSVTWYTTKSEGEIVPIDIPERFTVVEDHRSGTGTTALAQMLVDREIDVAFSTAPLGRQKVDGRHDRLKQGLDMPGDTEIERIFDDSRAVEASYYEETNIFPLMHAVVVSDDILERHPWVANKLYNAFEQALEECMYQRRRPRWIPLAWSNQYVEYEREVLGDNPWAYGLTPENRTALSKLQSYAADHGIIPEPLEDEELFVASTVK